MPWKSYATHLREECDALEEAARELVEHSTIEEAWHHKRPPRDMMVIGPSHHWGSASEELRRAQIATLPRFDRWVARASVMTHGAPADFRDEYAELTQILRELLSHEGSGWGVPETKAEAR